MSLKLLVDEDSQDKIFVAKLRKAGHDVMTATEAALLGQPDSAVLAYAVQQKRIVLTRNCYDFSNESAALQGRGGHHEGILLIYVKNDPEKDMSYDEIVQAVENVEKAVSAKELDLRDLALSLSYYRY